jgi:hypothetical protein
MKEVIRELIDLVDSAQRLEKAALNNVLNQLI